MIFNIIIYLLLGVIFALTYFYMNKAKINAYTKKNITINFYVYMLGWVVFLPNWIFQVTLDNILGRK